MKEARQEIDNQKLFSEQTNLINTINKRLDESVFSNFVPNYKTLASIYQVFSLNTKIKNKVLLEKSIVRYMASDNIKLCERENEVKASTVKIFTSKFNSTYSKLNEEQRTLLSKDVRKTLDNNYIIYDHPLFDIVVNPDKKKITTFIKRYLKADPYPHQDVFFDYLLRKGVILPDTIKGGNIFGSLEATYPDNKKIDVLKGILLSIYFYLAEEMPKLRVALDYDSEVDENNGSCVYDAQEFDTNFISYGDDESSELPTINDGVTTDIIINFSANGLLQPQNNAAHNDIANSFNLDSGGFTAQIIDSGGWIDSGGAEINVNNFSFDYI